jgi:hypothetical protein
MGMVDSDGSPSAKRWKRLTIRLCKLPQLHHAPIVTNPALEEALTAQSKDGYLARRKCVRWFAPIAYSITKGMENTDLPGKMARRLKISPPTTFGLQVRTTYSPVQR